MSANHKREDAERLYLFVRHLSRKLQDVDVACGISPARYSALVNLAFHGINNVGALAKTERVSRPAMTRLVKDMEKAGLVRRLADKSDGRGVLVALTPKGRGLVDKTKREKVALVARHLETRDRTARQAIALALDALEELGKFG